VEYKSEKVSNEKVTIHTGTGKNFSKQMSSGSSTNYVKEVTCMSTTCAPFIHFNYTDSNWWSTAMETSFASTAGTYIYKVDFYDENDKHWGYETMTFNVKF